MITLVAVIGALAIGTYAIRVAGVIMADRLALPEHGSRLLRLAAVALLAALAATAALTDAGVLAGPARPAGVMVGALLAWRRLPFALVIIAAALTTAALRQLGVP